MSEKTNSNRLEFLDSGRGFAVLYVVIFHIVFVPQLQYPPILKRFLEFGGSGVILFFVVSAFSLCVTMPKHVGQGSAVLSYAIARIFRIVPLFYIMLVITIWRDVAYRDMSFGLDKILASVFFVFNFNPEFAKGIVWASWTIGVEMPFYLLFPLLYLLLDNMVKKIAFALVIAVAVFVFDNYVVTLITDPTILRQYRFMNLLHNIPVFVIGMIAFDVYEMIKNKSHIHTWIGALIIILSLLGFCILAAFKYAKPVFAMEHATAIVYASLLIGLYICPTRIFTNAVTAFYAKICYSMYLWHPFIIFGMTPFYRYVYGVTASISIKLVVSIIVTMAIVTLVSLVSYVVIEQPGQKIGRSLLRRYRARKQIPEIIVPAERVPH